LIINICLSLIVPKSDKTTSYFDTTTTPSSTEESTNKESGNESLFPNKYDYKEDWGEKYTGVSQLGLYVLNIETGKVARIPGVPADVTAGQPIFTPCGRWAF
jgi:acylaminoacyl-peptidase